MWTQALTTYSQDVENVLNLARNTKITTMDLPKSPSEVITQGNNFYQ